jgi:hypothetical protein|tara:strand:- start:309 stop:494 length:186 start_codon:yes stop_codon:yes gene_type:complete
LLAGEEGSNYRLIKCNTWDLGSNGVPPRSPHWDTPGTLGYDKMSKKLGNDRFGVVLLHLKE